MLSYTGPQDVESLTATIDACIKVVNGEGELHRFVKVVEQSGHQVVKAVADIFAPLDAQAEDVIATGQQSGIDPSLTWSEHYAGKLSPEQVCELRFSARHVLDAVNFNEVAAQVA